ncbi:MAG TPA: Tim44-like domain-containing protein [Solirubrobacteraceae bacterium]|nr:Tim44-like domain-containing protein [Solirubrobacteraceae bacterium]
MNKRVGLVLLAVLVTGLLLAPEAIAAAGGGAGGFGGGGGGGGGGGRGAGLYILIQILIRIAIFGHGIGALVLIALIILAVVISHTSPRAKAFWTARATAGHAARRSTARRERRVELAAAEAAEYDPAFAPDVVKPAASGLFKDIQTAWSQADRARLRALVAPGLLTEWERRLDGLARHGWRNRVELVGEPRIEYVALSRRGQPEDRVTVRVEARLRDFVEDAAGHRIKRSGRATETVKVREFWTLGRRAGRWVLASIEQGAEGAHALADQIVATPWSDEQALRDEALLEGAAAEAVPPDTAVADVADLNFAGDARAAANDLSLADGRFAPDVLEIAARRAVAAWAQAVDGDDAPLLTVAAPRAARDLLHPGDPTEEIRLVVRGPRVKEIRITGLDAGAQPPTMNLEVDVEGRRYLEDRNTTTVLSGSRSRLASFTEHWTFALTDNPQQPWRIVASGMPLPQP